ncbi:MAG TPA: DUF4337 domain-containing protein [Candidatus Deferrimicrobiaceae bacterium]
MAEIELPNTEELEEARGKRFTRRVALTTAVYAVLLAITSLGGNNATKEMMLAQQQSTDQWNFYQAKNIRENFARNQRETLEAVRLERGNAMNGEARARYDELIRKAAAEEARLKDEKKAIGEAAKEQEKERDANRDKDPYFDYAEVLLQISIVLASIAILSGALPVYLLSIVSAGTGTILMVNGFLMLFRIPFLH